MSQALFGILGMFVVFAIAVLYLIAAIIYIAICLILMFSPFLLAYGIYRLIKRSKGKKK